MKGHHTSESVQFCLTPGSGFTHDHLHRARRGLSLAASLLAGYGMAGGKSRSWVHNIGFTAVMALAVYVILDSEYPRLGLIRVDGADPTWVQLRPSMN